jgi:hypothetical protein
MKIWLDDVRIPPFGWAGFVTPEECIDFILLCYENKEVIEEISLDHDLGLINGKTLEERTGYDVLLWLERNTDLVARYGPNKISIHSANPVAQRRMKMAVDSIYRLVG